MAEKFTSLPAAVLQIPDTKKDCFSSKAFAKQLRLFQSKISDIITMLEYKDKDDAFALTFEFEYHTNGVKGELTQGTNSNKFTLNCYCNGGD